MNILIIRVSAIGDVVHTFPAIFLLKFLFPHARISWVVQKKAATFLQGLTFLDNVWILPDHFLAPRNWGATYSIIKNMRTIEWDAIIDFQGIHKSTFLLMWLKGKKFGFSRQHARASITTLFTHEQISPVYTNIIQKNLALSSYTGYNLSARNTNPSLDTLIKSFTFVFPQETKRIVTTWLMGNKIKKPILLAPNTTWESKHWPVLHWVNFIKMLMQQPHILAQNYTPILVGVTFGQAAQEVLRELTAQNIPILCLPAWDLLTTGYIISQSKVLIAPDTGLLHMADFLQTTSIGIFGPTLASRHGPFLKQANKGLAFQINCPHFYQKTHANTQNSTESPTCMYKLIPEELINHIITLMGENVS